MAQNYKIQLHASVGLMKQLKRSLIVLKLSYFLKSYYMIFMTAHDTNYIFM